MNAVERVKYLCKARKCTVSKLENDCGFGNGYIASLKKGTLPEDRVIKVADYFGVPVAYIIGMPDEFGLTFDNWMQIGVLFDQAAAANSKSAASLADQIGADKDRVAWFLSGACPMSQYALINLASAIGLSLERIIGKEYATAIEHTADIQTDSRDFMQAAFFGGYADDLTPEERDGLWRDAQDFARFKAEQMRKEKKRKNG